MSGVVELRGVLNNQDFMCVKIMVVACFFKSYFSFFVMKYECLSLNQSDSTMTEPKKLGLTGYSACMGDEKHTKFKMENLNERDYLEDFRRGQIIHIKTYIQEGLYENVDWS